MDSDFNKIKKAMSEGHEQVPPEFSWDNMQGGILNKMERLQNMEEDKEDKKPFFFISRIGGTTLMALVMLLGYNIYWDTSYTNIATTSPTLLSAETAFEGNEISDEECNSLPFTQKAPNLNQVSIEIKAPIVERTNVYDSPEAVSIMQEPAIPTINQEQQSTLSNFKPTLTAVSIGVPQASVGEHQKSPSSDNTASLYTREFFVEQIARKSFVVSHAQQMHPLTEALPLPTIIEQKAQGAIKLPQQLLVSSGVTNWDMGYGNIQPERADFERELISFHTQILYSHSLKKQFFFSIGLQYQQLESRLNWSTTIENYQLTLEDTITAIQHNLITGTQQLIRGNIDVNVQAQRTVQHYNRTQLYQLPIAVGKTWMGQKFQFNLFAGSLFNLFTQNTGRHVSQQQLLDYNGQETAFLKNQWKVHALLGSTLTYQLNEKWGIATSIQAQKSIQNWSTEQDIDMKPTLINWGIGLNYRL